LFPFVANPVVIHKMPLECILVCVCMSVYVYILQGTNLTQAHAYVYEGKASFLLRHHARKMRGEVEVKFQAAFNLDARWRYGLISYDSVPMFQ
jgi:hypothetical protein